MSTYDQFNFFTKIQHYNSVFAQQSGHLDPLSSSEQQQQQQQQITADEDRKKLAENAGTAVANGRDASSLFANLCGICVGYEKVFLIGKSPAKIHVVPLRVSAAASGGGSAGGTSSNNNNNNNLYSSSSISSHSIKSLPLPQKHQFESYQSLLFASLSQNHEYLIAVGHVEDASVAMDHMRMTSSSSVVDQSSLQDASQLRHKIVVLMYRVSDQRLLRRIDLPYIDALHVKSLIGMQMEMDHPYRLVLAFETTDFSKSDVFIVQDPLGVHSGTSSQLLAASPQQIAQMASSNVHVDVIKVHRGAAICGFGFAWYGKKVVLYVASEKALWRVDLEKKSQVKVCNLRSGGTKEVGSAGTMGEGGTAGSTSMGCRIRCADISSGECPVFSLPFHSADSTLGATLPSPRSPTSPSHRTTADNNSTHQYVVAALADKLFLYDCNSTQIRSEASNVVELDYQATLSNKTKIRALWFNNYLILQSRDTYNRHILTIYSLSGKKFKAFEQCFARNQTIEDIATIGDRCIVLLKTIPQHQSSLAPEYSLLALEEKNMKSKLSILTKKFKYDQALEMALSQMASNGISKNSASAEMFEEEISDILKKSGDFMFSEREYDRAIRRYLGEDLPITGGDTSLSTLIAEKIRVEPSAVIRKFLDAQANEPLTKYLVKLHEIKQADAEHTKLLLECYIRDLQTPQSAERHQQTNNLLNQFLNQSRPLAEQTPIQMIAIKTLRRAGYRNRALSQAYKEPQHDKMIIQIEIEDYPLLAGRWNFKRALTHLESLRDFNLAIDMMEKYGSVFLRHIPQDSTNVMIRLCTPRYRAKKIEDKKRHFPLEEVAESMEQDQKVANTLKGGFSFLGALDVVAQADDDTTLIDRGATNEFYGELGNETTTEMEMHPEKFIKAFAGNDYWLMVFLESVIYSLGEYRRKNLSPIVFNTLLEVYLKYMHYDHEDVAALPRDHKTSYTDPTKRRRGSQGNGNSSPISLLDPQLNGAEDSVFEARERSNSLRSTGSTGSGNTGRTSNTGTLHLSDVPESEKALTPQQEKIMRVIKHYDYSICPATCALGKMNFQERIISLLEMEDPDTKIPLYDLEHALVLVQTANFERGVLLLYAKLNLHYDILQFYKTKKDYQKVVETCEEHGQRDPNIWIQVLTYFAEELKNTEDKASAEHHLKIILSQIKKRDILPPLMVVQVLSRNEQIQIGLIKDYLKQKLEKHHQTTEKCNNRINTLQNETNRMSKEIHELKTSARIFQKQKCCADGCGKNLDLPAVHFMCMHSYHQRCLPNEEECPKCAKLHKAAVQRYQSFRKRGENHEAFHKMFKKDGFSAVSHYFGLGIFSEGDSADAFAVPSGIDDYIDER